MDWVAILRDFGLPVMLVVFFTWTTFRRSDETDKFVRATLVGLIQSTTEAMNRNTEILNQLSDKVAACEYRKRGQD